MGHVYIMALEPLLYALPLHKQSFDEIEGGGGAHERVEKMQEYNQSW